ncbi:hypothetical protein E2562_000944 [Oryza meyeriana var. granulata]|uniref:Uncharacterized protein n=1 Tax=Oryza meyeriana var. granulata TaxID=110450 RepID=A0A6G1CXF8_9ORYZ|nr:hypothetical protein E2562_000944 [Oryza meyeriana var. granulata]
MISMMPREFRQLRGSDMSPSGVRYMQLLQPRGVDLQAGVRDMEVQRGERVGADGDAGGGADQIHAVQGKALKARAVRGHEGFQVVAFHAGVA